MVDFMCLPTELLLQVASYLHPYFYLDLALACKVLHKVLASGLAIHGAKYANWRNINLCSLDPPLDEASQRPNARTFLTKLIKEPDFVQYVESVDMDADASNFDDGTSHLNPWARIPTEKPAAADMALWKLSLSRNAILRKQKDSLDEASEVDDTDFSEGVEEIAARVSRAEQETAYVISFEAGYPAALMAHALCLCPELRALRFVPYVNNTSMMLHMLRNVSTLYKQQKMLHTPGLISPRDGIQLLSRVPELPFQRLTRVDLEHWDTEGGVDLEWVILFIKLPSLKKFYGRMIAESDSDLEGECGGYSQVTELSLEYSNIADDQWPYLFGEIADLKKFEYEYGGAIISYHEWDSFSTVGALQKYAGETLEELRLWISPDADDYESPDVRPSLKGFVKLEIFCCDWATIDSALEEDDAEVDEEDSALTGILPKSLRYLGIRLEHVKNAASVINLLQTGLQDLPHLEGIGVVGPKADQIRDLARQKGLEWKRSLFDSSAG